MIGKAGLFAQRIIGVYQPPFSSVVALLHLEGADGATATSDSSSFAIPVFFYGPTISTAQKRFGASSLRVSGQPYEEIILSPSQTIGTNDFTLEFFVRFSQLPTGLVALARWASGFEIWLYDSLYVVRVSSGSLTLSTYSAASPWSPATNTWYHVAVCRSGRFMRLFLDGVQLGVTVDLGVGFSFPSGNQRFGSSNPSIKSVDGWYDEIRVSLFDYYSANAPFTPPTAAFPDA